MILQLPRLRVIAACGVAACACASALGAYFGADCGGGLAFIGCWLLFVSALSLHPGRAQFIAAAALSVWFAFRSDGGEARVFVDGELRYTFSLAADGEYDILDGRMTIGVQGGEVYVVRSDCSEQLCVHSAPQSSEGSMIVCLPNRVVIVIGDREVDAVT